jgi:hypothetical protein
MTANGTGITVSGGSPCSLVLIKDKVLNNNSKAGYLYVATIVVISCWQ